MRYKDQIENEYGFYMNQLKKILKEEESTEFNENWRNLQL